MESFRIFGAEEFVAFIPVAVTIRMKRWKSLEFAKDSGWEQEEWQGVILGIRAAMTRCRKKKKAKCESNLF